MRHASPCSTLTSQSLVTRCLSSSLMSRGGWLKFDRPRDVGKGGPKKAVAPDPHVLRRLEMESERGGSLYTGRSTPGNFPSDGSRGSATTGRAGAQIGRCDCAVAPKFRLSWRLAPKYLKGTISIHAPRGETYFLHGCAPYDRRRRRIPDANWVIILFCCGLTIVFLNMYTKAMTSPSRR